MSERTHWVYMALDADGFVLYVGATGNRARRYREHMSGNGSARGWFHPFVTRWHVAGPFTPTKAREIERGLIASEQPIWNGTSLANRNAKYALVDQYLDERGVRFAPDGTCRPRLVTTLKSVSA